MLLPNKSMKLFLKLMAYYFFLQKKAALQAREATSYIKQKTKLMCWPLGRERYLFHMIRKPQTDLFASHD